MFQRFHEARARREEGFTLIELLVVVLIIAILAAIAVPVFLNQRRKAWISQVESALKDSATAQESWRTDNTAYTSSWDNLTSEGFNYSSQDVRLETIDANDDGYCLRVESVRDDDIVGVYSSEDGRPVVEDDNAVTGTAAGGGANCTNS